MILAILRSACTHVYYISSRILLPVSTINVYQVKHFSVCQVKVLFYHEFGMLLVPSLHGAGHRRKPSMVSLPSRPTSPRLLAARRCMPYLVLICVSLFVLLLQFNKKQMRVCLYRNLYYLLLELCSKCRRVQMCF